MKRVTAVDSDVLQREFIINVSGEEVPSVLWIPINVEPRVLVAMGHGGSQHKKSDNIRARAMRYARDFGWASLAIDAPNHGDRISAEEAAIEKAKTRARIQGRPISPALTVAEKLNYLDNLAKQAVPEWQAVLDFVFNSKLIKKNIAIAYLGVSQGSSIGIPLLAADNRFKCAILGLTQLHPDHESLRLAAQKITIPIRFIFQWNDAIRKREYGLALFDAFASKEKSMHINNGGHSETPKTEMESWDRFFRRYL